MSKETISGRQIKSCYWFYCSAIAFVLWVLASIMAEGTANDIGQSLHKFHLEHRITSRFLVSTEGNPAPSVTLKVTSAPWCLPCQRLKPVLNDLKKEGYRIEIVELQRPNKPEVPTLEFYRFDVLERTEVGYKTPEKLREYFASVEGTVF